MESYGEMIDKLKKVYPVHRQTAHYFSFSVNNKIFTITKDYLQMNVGIWVLPTIKFTLPSSAKTIQKIVALYS